MSKIEDAIQELVQVRDELNLKTHLFQMEIKAEWQALCTRLNQLETELEHDLVTLCQKIGHAEEEFFVGDEQEIQSLVTDFKNLRDKL